MTKFEFQMNDEIQMTNFENKQKAYVIFKLIGKIYFLPLVELVVFIDHFFDVYGWALGGALG